MLLRTVVRDCLLLNWALPASVLPEVTSPLRYQLHSWQGEDWVFASAVFFRQEGLHVEGLLLPRLSYPQFNLRLYVLDGDGTPSVLIRQMLMPAWLAPAVRLFTHQPAASARLEFPHPARDIAWRERQERRARRNGGSGAIGGGAGWRWRVERSGVMEVRAWVDSPRVGPGPPVGSWEETVEYFQERPRGYVEQEGNGMRCIEAAHPAMPVWPLRAEIDDTAMLGRMMALGEGVRWPELHSCWLCPEIPFVFELGLVPRMAMAPAVTRAAATSRSAALETVGDSGRAARDRSASARTGPAFGCRIGSGGATGSEDFGESVAPQPRGAGRSAPALLDPEPLGVPVEVGR